MKTSAQLAEALEILNNLRKSEAQIVPTFRINKLKISQPNMAEMSLTSSGQTKVLSFEEFTAAQAGGMTAPTAGEEPEVPTEPIVAEPETPELPDEVSATEPSQEEIPATENEPDQDEVTLLGEPEGEPEKPAPSADEAEEPTV